MYDLQIARRGKVYLGFAISLKGVYLEVYDIVAKGTVYEKLDVFPFIREKLKPSSRKDLDELAGACSSYGVKGDKREGTIAISRGRKLYWCVEQTENGSTEEFVLYANKAIFLLTIGVKNEKRLRSRQIKLRWSELNDKLGNPLKHFKLVM